MTTVKERLEALKGKNRKIVKPEETKIDRRKFNRGHPGSGRKPSEMKAAIRGIRYYVDKHYSENTKFKVVDPKTGQSKIVSKPRVVWILEKLFEIGMKDGNPLALKDWLNRGLGMPPQSIQGGDEDKPILIKLDF